MKDSYKTACFNFVIFANYLLFYFYSSSVQEYMVCLAGPSVILDLSLKFWILQERNQRNALSGRLQRLGIIFYYKFCYNLNTYIN